MTPSRTVLWAASAGVGLALAITCVAASAGTAVADRQAAMKQVGGAMKDGSGLMAAFDAGKAKAAMDVVAANAHKLKGLYPADSMSDPKTAADPKIWQDKADFDKRLDQMASLASVAGKAKDADSYKTAFRALGDTCKSCHDVYRMKKKA